MSAFRIQLCIVLIACLATLTVFAAPDAEMRSPLARDGVMDLREWNLAVDGPVDLVGEWEFYWSQFLDNQDFEDMKPGMNKRLVSLPNLWNDLEIRGDKLPADGYATYRLRILLNRKDLSLAMKMRDINTAFSLYIDGKKLGQVGTVSDRSDNGFPRVKPFVVDFTAEGEELEVILHVSNYHDSIAGVRQVPIMGLEKDIRQMQRRSISIEFLMFGSILIMALYHLGLFILRRKDPSALYFSVFCFLMALRTLLTGERIFVELFPQLSWPAAVKIEIFTFYLAVPAFFMFFQAIFSWKFSKKLLHAVQAVGVGLSLFVAVTPVDIGTQSLPVFQVFSLLMILYAIYVIILSVKNRKEGAIIFSAGFMVLILTAVNDILYAMDFINTGFWAPVGVFAFIFSQAFLLSVRFSGAFSRVETLSGELQEKSDELSEKNIELQQHKDNLEQMVIERTESIKVLLDNTGQGFMTFRPNYKVDPLYSRACRTFFQGPIEERNAFELLFGPDGAGEPDSIREMMEMVFSGAVDIELLQDILPKELALENRILKVDYRLIPPVGTEKENRIMMILTDITRERQLSEQLQEDEERKDLIVKIAIDKTGFIEFIHNMNNLFRSIYDLLAAQTDRIDADALFRCYHTIKGGAAAYALSRIAARAHEIESGLDAVRNGEITFTPDLVKEQIQHTEAMEEDLKKMLNEFKDIIPDEELNPDERFYQIADSKLAGFQKRLLELIPEDLHDLIVKQFDVISRQPVAPILRRYRKSAEELAEKLGKEIKVELEGLGVEVPTRRFERLFNSLVHLVRNCVDHGLEIPDLRTLQQKSVQGTLSITAVDEDSQFRLTISDDGNGIEVDRIKSVAIGKDLISESEADEMKNEEVLNLVFRPGFSTAESVSDISGRGVGMDAVLACVKDLGGDISIKTEPGRGTTFDIVIPML